MINALSIDLEFWWCSEFLKKYICGDLRDQIYESVYPIVKLLERYNTCATFFVLGMVAEKYPDLIEDLYDKGHEIASHSYSHEPLHLLGKKQFEREVIRSVALLKKYRPVGFRAPSFSINDTTKWALEVLVKYGFVYDSSIFPIRTNLYGVPKAPNDIYRPSFSDIACHDPEGKIVEFPLTTVNLGFNLPIAGGFYLRALPATFLKWGVEHVNKKRPAIIYIHPWETFPNTPRLNVPFFPRFVSYIGINSALNKLEMLLHNFKFDTVMHVIQNVL